MTASRASRWRLHRGGILNIWQFGERVFDFSDGRVILQGVNGSGKSRTLELLLPLCLDGDLRHLGAKGYDSVSIRRLMLDDYSGGPNRIGYSWVELRRASADGGEEFLASGVGVKASRATQEIASSWRFMTPLRVGIDFELAGLDKVPLDQKELRERIGADAVMDDPGLMQQRLAAVVYGIEDARRYEDLLHMLRTLRNPDVGVRAVEGQLEEYLSMSLPPLDHEVTKRLAIQFQDLESIRDSMRRLSMAHEALSEFLLTYRQYAARVTRERVDCVFAARTSLSAHLEAAEGRARDIAREAGRLRRIAVLTALLEELQTRRELQRLRSEDARASLAAREDHVRRIPGTAPVAVAQSLLATAREAETEAERMATDTAKEHAAADGAWQAKHGEFTRRASGAGLPETSSAIAQRLGEVRLATAAAAALTSSLNDQYLPAVTQAARPLTDFATAADTRREGEADALTRRDAYIRAEQALRLHIEALGFDSQEFDTRLSELEERLEAAKSEIPEVRGRHEQAKTNVTRIETLQGADPATERGKRQELAAHVARFDNALAAAGLWAAAAGSDRPPPTARDDALQAAASWSADASEADLINALQTLRTSLPAGYDAKAIENDGVLAILVSDGEGSHPAAAAAARSALRLAEHEEQLDAHYQDIFEDFLLRDLAERLREQIDAADHLCQGMNAILSRAQSSQGIHVQLSWNPSPALDDATRDALALVRTSFTTRSPDQDARLRDALRELIEAERDKHDAHYAEVLTRALDYRDWYTFTVRVRDAGPDGQPRSRMLRRLSSGETRVVSYVTLFAAVAAFYDTLDMAGSTPLRLVLLDEAFERVDDPTKTRLLELLADLDIDWVITWPGGSVLSAKIDRMHIYDVFRPTGAPGMAFVHATWDGIERQRGA